MDKKQFCYRPTVGDLKRIGSIWAVIGVVTISFGVNAGKILNDPLMFVVKLLIFFGAFIIFGLILKIYFTNKNNNQIMSRYDKEKVDYVDQIISEVSKEFTSETTYKVVKEFSNKKFGGNAFILNRVRMTGDWYALSYLSDVELRGAIYQTLWHEFGHKDNEPHMVFGIFELYASVVKFKNWTRECRCDRYGKRALIERGYSDEQIEALACLKWDDDFNGDVTHPGNELRKRIYLSKEPFIDIVSDIAMDVGLNPNDKRIDDYTAQLNRKGQISNL